MKKILVIYTGGTIGGEDKGHGLWPMPIEKFQNYFDDVLSQNPQIQAEVKLIKAPRTIDSTSALIPDWNNHTKIVSDEYEGYDAFLILGGTDTMDYMVAAYSEILQNAGKPIISTGSMLSIAAEGSDAPDNILTALRACAHDDLKGVFLAFGEYLHSPAHVAKFSTEANDAFRTPFYKPVGRVENNTLSLAGSYNYAENDKEFNYSPLAENYVPTIHFSAGNNDPSDQINFDKKPRAILVFGHGNGNIPSTEEAEKFFEVCRQKDISVFIRTRVPEGDANTVYQAGTWFLTENVVKLGRMTEASSVMALQRHLTDGLRGEELRQAMRERVASYIPQ